MNYTEILECIISMLVTFIKFHFITMTHHHTWDWYQILAWVIGVSFLLWHWSRLEVRWNYEGYFFHRFSSETQTPAVIQSDLYISQSEHIAMEKKKNRSGFFNQFSSLTLGLTITQHMWVKVRFDKPHKQPSTDVIKLNSCGGYIIIVGLIK